MHVVRHLRHPDAFVQPCLLLATAWLYASSAIAEEQTLHDIIPDVVVKTADVAVETAGVAVKSADVSRDFVSDEFISFVNGIDHFFGSERDFQERNESVLQLDLSEVVQQGGSYQGQFNGRTKVSLPSTEKRLHLLVEGDPEKNATGTDTNKPKTVEQLNAPQTVGVAARYEKAAESAWHYSTDLGIRAPLPLQPFVRTRVSYSFPLETWRAKLAQSAYWFSLSGAGESTQLDIENQFNIDALFRATSTATWSDVAQSFSLSQEFSVYHTLDSKRAVLYQASVLGSSKPIQVNDYVLSAAYRQQLGRRWLFFEFNPQLHFPQTTDYQLTPVLLLRLEVWFDAVKEPPPEAVQDPAAKPGSQ